MAWSTYLSKDQMHLYINITTWIQETYNRKTKDYRDPFAIIKVPEDASPATVHEGENTRRLHHRSVQYTTEEEITAYLFQQHINQLPCWKQDLLKHFDLHNNTIHQIHEICKTEEAYVVSDGSPSQIKRNILLDTSNEFFTNIGIKSRTNTIIGSIIV